MSTIFDLEQTSYWLLLIWIFGAGFLLYKMPKKAEMVCGRVQMRWYWSTALLLTLPYILWAAYRTGGADRLWDNYGQKLNIYEQTIILQKIL